ncbi:hypothetical protein ACFQ4X_07050 [Fictibacillus halophilus]|uniref:hypothetical protein n=1 Tax=Fictibacillus halophilus TaxID=1610490 RepID=UPI0036346577
MKTRTQQKKLDKLDLSQFKLLPSAKPPLFHGSTIRKTAQYLWTKKIRPAVLDQYARTCSVCGWVPENETEIKRLHLHEIEEYDFKNKVCHLRGIELICLKCHSFHHIVRTKAVSTKEQWEDLMQHFIKVNDCSPAIIEDFEWIISQSLQQDSNLQSRGEMSWDELRDLADKPVSFTISPDVPFAEELTKTIANKRLLYQE